MYPTFVYVMSKKGPLYFAHAIQKLCWQKASYIFHFFWEFACAHRRSQGGQGAMPPQFL